MTRDDVLHIMRALGFRPAPDFDPPPFTPRAVVELRCDCGRGFGLDIDRLVDHCDTDHGRLPSRDERTPR